MRPLLAICLVMFVGPVVGLPQDERPLLVNVCDLKRDPEAYNHKLVQVQGKVSHEFEDFSVHDAGCPDFKNTTWLMYGGNAPNDVTYCCGVTVGSKNQVVSKYNEVSKSAELWRGKDSRRVATEALTAYLKDSGPALEFKGCKSKHRAYPEKKDDQYQTICQWTSGLSDSYSVELMKYYFLKSPSNSWDDVSWMPYQISHQHCSENPDPE